MFDLQFGFRSLSSSPPEVFLLNHTLKICCKFTGEQPCRSPNSIKLLCTSACSPAGLLYIFIIYFPKNTSDGLVLTTSFIKSCSNNHNRTYHDSTGQEQFYRWRISRFSIDAWYCKWWHTTIKNKLYGVRGIAHDLLKYYSTNRKQQTVINGMSWSVLSITYGVPQRSLLGPFLFLIHVSHLNHVVKHWILHHFADESDLLFSSSH